MTASTVVKEGSKVLLGALTSRFAHGLLIIAAPESSDPHDDWDPANDLVHAGPDSLYVEVLSAPSGLVYIECHEGDQASSDLIQVFSGEMRLESKRISIYDPNQTVLLTINTKSQLVRVLLFADAPEEPSRLHIYVS